MTIEQMQPGAGNLGLTRRSYERLYYNARQTLGSVDYLVNRIVPWAIEHVDDTMEYRRIVGRIIMTESQLSEALSRSDVLRKNIEVAIPVGEYYGAPITMVMWGINNHREQPLDRLEHIERETEYRRPADPCPAVRVELLRGKGYRFVDNLDEIETRDVHSLWGPIFEWPQQDIDALRTRLRQQSGVWFTAVMDGQEVVALAMAEGLNLPLGNGESIPVVESTEWCVRPQWQDQGLGIGAVSHVHAQVIQDFERAVRPPVILAETNFTSRADRIGHGAGMVVGPRLIESIPVPQVLRQNVAIGDGLRPNRLRDFTMMYISAENITQYYSSGQREQILGREI